jgi:hypothetical protein
MTMNKVLILLFLIITLSVKSQSIDEVIVDKTIEYIGDCLQNSEQKKITRYKYIEHNKTKFYKDFDVFDSIIKYDFTNTYKTFTSSLIEIKNESDSSYFVFIKKLIVKNENKFEKYFASEIIHELKDKKKEEVIHFDKPDKTKNSLYFVIVLLLISLIVVGLKKQKTKEAKKEKKQEPNIYLRNPCEEEIDKYKDQLKTFQLKIEDLELKLSDLNNQKKNDVIIKIKDDEITEDPEIPSQKQYYLYAPIAYKTFSDDHKSEHFDIGNSMFLFTISNKETQAKFEFCGENKVLSYALNFPDESIERVCEYENSKTDFKSKIITTSPGEAELRDSKWVVTKPAKIKFQ